MFLGHYITEKLVAGYFLCASLSCLNVASCLQLKELSDHLQRPKYQLLTARAALTNSTKDKETQEVCRIEDGEGGRKMQRRWCIEVREHKGNHGGRSKKNKKI